MVERIEMLYIIKRYYKLVSVLKDRYTLMTPRDIYNEVHSIIQDMVYAKIYNNKDVELDWGIANDLSNPNKKILVDKIAVGNYELTIDEVNGDRATDDHNHYPQLAYDLEMTVGETLRARARKMRITTEEMMSIRMDIPYVHNPLAIYTYLVNALDVSIKDNKPLEEEFYNAIIVLLKMINRLIKYNVLVKEDSADGITYIIPDKLMYANQKFFIPCHDSSDNDTECWVLPNKLRNIDDISIEINRSIKSALHTVVYPLVKEACNALERNVDDVVDVDVVFN